MSMNNKYISFDGRMIKKIERQELIKIGATEQGLINNYDDSDNIICITDDEQYVYEFIGSVDRNNFTGCWNVQTFLQWFNAEEFTV